MKILYVLNERPWPANNGVRIVSYNAMRLMKERGHELAVAILESRGSTEAKDLDCEPKLVEDEFVYIKSLSQGKPRWKNALQAITRNLPYFFFSYDDQEFSAGLHQLIVEFQPDVIHIDLVTMTGYMDKIHKDYPTVLSINDSYALSLKNRIDFKGHSFIYSLAKLYQYLVARKYEKDCYPKSSAVHVMSHVDKEFLLSLNKKIECTDIPNGVDDSILETNISKGHSLVFVGKLEGANLSYISNFLENCWSSIKALHPTCHIRIVGGVSPEATAFVSKYHEDNSVEFVGYVDSIVDAYEDTSIAIVPIDKDCGVINKAMEPIAAGIPTVGFTRAFAGLKGAVSGTHYVGVDSYEQFTSEIVRLLSNKSLMNQIGESGMEFARENFTWASRSGLYEDLYKRAANSFKRHH